MIAQANNPSLHVLTKTASAPALRTASSSRITGSPLTEIEAQPVPHSIKEASTFAFFTAQMARHALPVAGTRTLAQGLVAPALARLIKTHPQAALATQGAIAIHSMARVAMSYQHTQSRSAVADAAFSGWGEGPGITVRRQVWQTIQRVGVLISDVLAITLTAASISRPELTPIAQRIAAINARAHLLSQGREFLRPTINTVHVGSNAPGVIRPADGRHLRSEDVTLKMQTQFGSAVAISEFVAQMLMQLTLGGRPAWEAGSRLAVAAGAISGLANTVTSSVEDHLVDSAAARRMHITDPAHVRYLHNDSRSPFSYRELGRQMERVDVRVFNQVLPALIAAGITYGLEKLLSTPSTFAHQASTAGISMVVHAVVLSCLLSVTTQTYQVNDAVRNHRADA
ncbi:hypothetical protein [Pseudomonas sp. FP1740]|uniref:hypothetical protein n=1 Tax=Pseudomonas sp. FP1740 TaxID=2954078 RepID=UPI00273778AE|nr:hypothetical protein [Pseudomonas sp. FP1740]WLG46846.1 hypothetical protein PSH69_09660 [Pseudomonas sp. FP1740]